MDESTKTTVKSVQNLEIDKNKKQRSPYFGLVIFDVCFTLTNLFCIACMASLPLDTGYGGLAIGIPLLLIDLLIMPFRGVISYVKYRNIFKTHFIFVVVWMIALLLIQFALPEEAIILIGFRWCIFVLFSSLIGSFLTILILKAKKHFLKTEERESVFEENTDKNDLNPLTAKPSELLKKQKEATCETPEKTEATCDPQKDHENSPSEKYNEENQQRGNVVIK